MILMPSTNKTVASDVVVGGSIRLAQLQASGVKFTVSGFLDDGQLQNLQLAIGKI
jgi:hypothetical protein